MDEELGADGAFGRHEVEDERAFALTAGHRQGADALALRIEAPDGDGMMRGIRPALAADAVLDAWHHREGAREGSVGRVEDAYTLERPDGRPFRPSLPIDAGRTRRERRIKEKAGGWREGGELRVLGEGIREMLRMRRHEDGSSGYADPTRSGCADRRRSSADGSSGVRSSRR